MKHVVAYLLCLVAGTVGADSWLRQPVTAQASPTGLRVVRVIPGTDKGAVFGFAGEPRGRAATAVVYRLSSSGNYVKYAEFQLLNPIAPVFMAISDSGELITLDNWHNMGIGKSVVVLYSPEGRVMRSLGLMDMYSSAEITKFRLSTSSIWWRCPSQPQLEPRTSTLEIIDALGSILEIHLTTGEFKRSRPSQTSC